MTRRPTPYSFSDIATTVLASISGARSGSGTANPIRLRGKLDLSLWRDIGNDEIDDDEEEEELEESGRDGTRGVSPQPPPSPILAPLLAAKKQATSDQVYDDKVNDSTTGEIKRRLSPLPGTNQSLLSEYGQSQKGSLGSLLRPPSVSSSSSSFVSLLRNGNAQGESGGGSNAVVGQEKPQENESYSEILPPILQSSSSTTAALLSSFIGSYQLSSGSQFPSGGEGVRCAEATPAPELTRRVKFTMEGDQAQGTSSSIPQSTTEKGKRSGSGKDAVLTRSRSGSAARRPLSRTQTSDILQEIRKMSLASQDALEEKKKSAGDRGNPPSSGRKFGRKAKQKKRKAEETFTDKDRAAAVTLGSKDIKQSLKAKKKRDRKMRLSISFISGEEYVIGTLLGEANYQMRVKKQPEAALQTLNKALEIQPTHKGALVARSQCYLKLGNAESALKDAQQAWDPNDPNETYTQGLYQYAEALYQLGEFENALIAFHRGHRSRKDMDGFRIGIQKCQEAIRRAIGDKTATSIPHLDSVLPLIQELEDTKFRLPPEERKEVEEDPNDSLLKNIAKYRLGDNIQLSSLTETKVKSRLISRELMGQLCLDKAYLKKFVNRPEVINQQGLAKGLRDEACEALKYLESRERFWRQQNPLYSRKNFATVLKAHAHDLAFKEKSVSVEPSVAKYLQRRRSSVLTTNLPEGSPPPALLQRRRRSSEPQLEKIIAKGEGGGGQSKTLKKTPSIQSIKGNKKY